MYNSLDGQPANISQFTCPINNITIQFTWSLSAHSAWQPSTNCSVPLCRNSSNPTSNDCQRSSITCFQYHTATNTRYCAPASLCSILETCDNARGSCSSNASVCVVNSCCTHQAICLPLAWTHMCMSSNETSKLSNRKPIEFTSLYTGITMESTTYTSTTTTSTTTTPLIPGMIKGRKILRSKTMINI